MVRGVMQFGLVFLMRLAARLSFVALLASAPLACVLFCAAVSDVNAHGAPRGHVAHHAPDHDGPPAPLNEIQQLMHAVTDSLPMAPEWSDAWHVVAAPIAPRPAAQRADLPPPTPPPRPAASA
jgi:hypothetical protein